MLRVGGRETSALSQILPQVVAVDDGPHYRLLLLFGLEIWMAWL